MSGWPLAQMADDSVFATGLLVIGILFICAWLLMRLRKRSLKGPGFPTARENLERYRQKDAVRDDLERIMVDIEQLAKRLGAQLDAKALQVEKLIDDADLRIAQLQRAMREQHLPPTDAERRALAGPALTGGPAELSTLPASDPPGTPHQTAPGVASDIASGNASPPVGATAGGNEPTASVHRLADQGLSAAEIARQLNEHVGKVELILALRSA